MQEGTGKARRALFAVVVLALFTAVGLMPTFVQAEGGARFTLPERRAGDAVDYDFTGQGGLPFMFSSVMVEEPMLWKDEHGSWHRADVVTEEFASFTMGETHFASKFASLVDAEAWVPLAASSTASGGYSGVEQFLPLAQSESSMRQSWGFFPGISFHPCGILNGLQGAEEWEPTIVVGGECVDVSPAEFQYSHSATWKGKPSMVYGAENVQLTFAPGIPYPVEIRFTRDGGDGVATLVGFHRGTTEIRHVDELPPNTPLPSISYTTANRLGPDLGALDDAYPIEQMLVEARDDASYNDVRDFMEAYPDWRVNDADLYLEEDGQRWIVQLSSEHDGLRFIATRTPRDVGGATIPPEEGQWEVSYRTSEISDGPAPVLEDMDSSVPSAESVADAWQAYAETDEHPNSIGFTYGFCVVTICSTSATVAVGNVPVEPESEQESPLGLQDPPQEWEGTEFQLVAGSEGIEQIRMTTSSYERAAGFLAEPTPSDDGESVESGIVLDAPKAAVGLFAGLAAAASIYFWPALKTLPGFSLFSRLKTPELLNHPTRSAIMQVVQDSPGIHFKELQRRTQLANGTLRHHVRYMSDAGLMSERRQGGFTCYYPGEHIPADTLAAAPVLKSDTARDVLAAIKQRPGTSVAQIARQTGLAGGTIGYHVKRLKDAGLVEGRRERRTVQLFPTAAAQRAAAA